MPAKPYWLLTKHKFILANITVYVAIIILLFFSHTQLLWAQKTLRAYLFNGDIPASKDKLLIGQATEQFKAGGKIEVYKPLLEKALEIDPYSEANLLLGIIALRQGDEQTMLQYYDTYRSIDPYVSAIYTQMATVLIKQGRRKEAQSILADGIKSYEKRLDLYKPVTDSNVPSEFNQKAVYIYQKTRQELDLLKQINQKITEDTNDGPTKHSG